MFPRPDKLKLHMLRHSDHREFLCANCGKQFKRKDKLKEHMQRMHAPDREAKLAGIDQTSEIYYTLSGLLLLSITIEFAQQ